MTYKINKTDGNLLTEIPDGEFDTSASSLTLIGRNVTSFGETINENFVKLLENFASASAPSSPLKGQIWYDTSTGRLNVYDGVDFRTSGGPLISATTPTNMVPGDLWINNSTNQLWFFDGTDMVLAGPSYTNQQGLSGFQVETVLDSLNRTKVITKLYSNNVLLGIFSSTAFTPYFPIPGFTGEIGVGFTASSLANLKFDVTVTKSESLVTSQGEVKTADDLVFNTEDSTIYGSLTIQSVDGVRVLGGDPGLGTGAQGDSSLKLEGGNLILENNESGRSIQIRTKKPIEGIRTAVHIDAVNQRLGLFNVAPTATVDITGDLKISGNLIVGGDTVTINVTNLEVEDKTLELNKSPTGAVTDAMADGGGIVLNGDASKTILYNNPQAAWVSSEHFSLAANKQYKINGSTVLTSTSLGADVVNSSLQTLGKLTQLNLSGGINVTGNVITGGTNSAINANQDLILTSTTGNVNVNGKRITNVADLNYLTSPASDAANKKYVDERALLRPVSLTMDVSDYDISTSQGLLTAIEQLVIPTLNKISPIYSEENPAGQSVVGTIANIHVYQTSVTLGNIIYNPVEEGTVDQPGETAAYTKTLVDANGNFQSSSVVQDLLVNQVITPPTASVSVTRRNLGFQVQVTVLGSTEWVFIGELI